METTQKNTEAQNTATQKNTIPQNTELNAFKDKAIKAVSVKPVKLNLSEGFEFTVGKATQEYMKDMFLELVSRKRKQQIELSLLASITNIEDRIKETITTQKQGQGKSPDMVSVKSIEKILNISDIFSGFHFVQDDKVNPNRIKSSSVRVLFTIEADKMQHNLSRKSNFVIDRNTTQLWNKGKNIKSRKVILQNALNAKIGKDIDEDAYNRRALQIRALNDAYKLGLKFTQ